MEVDLYKINVSDNGGKAWTESPVLSLLLAEKGP